MNCKHCGFDLSSSSNFCPNCGGKFEDSNPQTPKRSFLWFKALIVILASICAGIFFIALFSNDLTDTVSGQLEAIKEGKITDAYYSFTSKTFQEATSLEAFREVLQNIPVLLQNKTLNFIDRKVEDDRGQLQAILISTQGLSTKIGYQLIKEAGKWKISSIKIEEQAISPLENEGQVTEQEPIISMIETQLKAFQEGNLKGAYEGLVSKQFIIETPWEDFENYIKSHPIFSQFTDKHYDKTKADEKKGVAVVALESPTEKVKIFYRLIKEEGKWKIWGLHLEEALTFVKKKADIGDSFQFGEFILGNHVDAKGIVVSSKRAFNADFGDIYLNIPINNAEMNTLIEVVFQHIESNSQIIPVSTKVLKEGDSVVSFVFSPPSKGWPQGNYVIQANSSAGVKGYAEFKINRSFQSILSDAFTNFPRYLGVYQSAADSDARQLLSIIEGMLNELRKNQFEKAYEEYTSDQFRKQTTFAQFKEFVSKFPVFYKNKSFQSHSFYSENGIITFQGVLSSTEGNTIDVEFDLAKEQKNWRILGIQLFMPEISTSRTEAPLK